MPDRTLIGAIDQGTSSSRFLIFDSRTSELLTYHQIELSSIYPQEGWVEQDPLEILRTVTECTVEAINNLSALGLDILHIKAIGITNQRETTIVWDKITGKPLHNAIVWLDTRTASVVAELSENGSAQGINQWRERTGLPISTYFSALKLRWLLDNSEDVQNAVRQRSCLFGTVDSWLLWNLTGGADGGVHATDVTNASRSMLMNLHTLKWDDELCSFFGIPKEILPEIRSSAEIFGKVTSIALLQDVPISGILGDQQASLVGQMCFEPGQAKNTYGTGCFMLCNTGTSPVLSKNGLLTTVGYQLGPDKPVFYCLEGSVAIAGEAVRWLRDNLELFTKSSDIEALAKSAVDNGGCYFVPAFSGLFCPYWHVHARGVICGLSQYTDKSHLARACLEAVCFQSCELLEAMEADSGEAVSSLQVDGGMTCNDLLMQLQADLGGLTIIRPSMVESTALGVAMAAGYALDIWCLDDDSTLTVDRFLPVMDEASRKQKCSVWKEAVKRTMNWTGSAATDEHPVFAVPLAMFMFSSFALLTLVNSLK